MPTYVAGRYVVRRSTQWGTQSQAGNHHQYRRRRPWLRRSATAYVIVSHSGATRQYSTILKKKSDPSWSNHRSNGPIIWNLPPGVTHKNVQGFGISLQSHGSGFETDDNWNINRGLVTYPSPGGAQVPLAQEAECRSSASPPTSPNGTPPNWPHNVVHTQPQRLSGSELRAASRRLDS
jgi:hypothetical protein